MKQLHVPDVQSLSLTQHSSGKETAQPLAPVSFRNLNAMLFGAVEEFWSAKLAVIDAVGGNSALAVSDLSSSQFQPLCFLPQPAPNMASTFSATSSSGRSCDSDHRKRPRSHPPGRYLKESHPVPVSFSDCTSAYLRCCVTLVILLLGWSQCPFLACSELIDTLL